MWLKAASARGVLRLTAVLPVVCAFWIVSGDAAQNPASNFEIITNQGHQASRANPRSAIANYYEPNLDSPHFARASAPLQERFLYDYLQACNRAAEHVPERMPLLTKRYRNMAVMVATKYITWFRDAEQRGVTSELPALRIEAVVQNLGSARILAGTRADLIYDYEGIPLQNAYYFNSESLRLWEDSLRLSVESLMTDHAVRARLAKDPEYAFHWKAFRTVLERVANRGGRGQGFATGRLETVKKLLTQPGL